MTDVSKMTKKEMTERLLVLEEQRLTWEEERNRVSQQVSLMQKEHGRRLAFLRILEAFANTVDTA